MVMDGTEGHQYTGGPYLWRRSAVDTCHVPLVGNANICKSQRTVMTPLLHSDMLGFVNEGITNIIMTMCNYFYK
jgi:hypothetical protein